MTLTGKIVTFLFICLFVLMLLIQSEKPLMGPVDEETMQEAMPEEVYRDFQEFQKKQRQIDIATNRAGLILESNREDKSRFFTE